MLRGRPDGLFYETHEKQANEEHSLYLQRQQRDDIRRTWRRTKQTAAAASAAASDATSTTAAVSVAKAAPAKSKSSRKRLERLKASRHTSYMHQQPPFFRLHAATGFGSKKLPAFNIVSTCNIAERLRRTWKHQEQQQQQQASETDDIFGTESPLFVVSSDLREFFPNEWTRYTCYDVSCNQVLTLDKLCLICDRRAAENETCVYAISRACLNRVKI